MHWTKNFSSLTLFLLGAACASSPDVASLPSWCERLDWAERRVRRPTPGALMVRPLQTKP